MGKVTGFMEYQRVQEVAEAPAARIKHYKEFFLHLDDAGAATQAARCMDCGIPFCNSGCPVNNIIPDWNELVYRGNYQEALDILHSTNNFPEFTGRICPAPCETACTLGLIADPVGIKSVEHFIIDKGWENDWIKPQPARHSTGKKIAIVGSGPAGLSAAQQLVRVGHAVTLFEKNDRIGGLLRYGIPDFKLEKSHIDRRIQQMQAEGVVFKTNVLIAASEHAAFPENSANRSWEVITPAQLQEHFDAIILAGGAEQPRDLLVPGRELKGVHFAMDFLLQQNKVNAGDKVNEHIKAAGKHVIVIGGGDTGSDCIGTANRQMPASVTQFELLPMPPEKENTALVWPYWPLKLRTSSSQEEGCQRDWSVATKRLEGRHGQVEKLVAVRVEWREGKMQEIPDSEFEIKADLILLAMGFLAPLQQVLTPFGVELDARGNVRAATEGPKAYFSSVNNIFAAGDMRRGQSLVVWAIREGRQCARAVDQFLMGSSLLPL